MARPTLSFRLTVASAALAAATLALTLAPSTARAVDHTQVVPREGFGHGGFGHGGFGHEGFGRRFHRSPSFGLFFGAPVVVVPPPLYYDPYFPYATYSYAPVPISGIYVTAYGYCRDYQTNAGVETACQGADGIWRFIN